MYTYVKTVSKYIFVVCIVSGKTTLLKKIITEFHLTAVGYHHLVTVTHCSLATLIIAAIHRFISE